VVLGLALFNIAFIPIKTFKLFQIKHGDFKLKTPPRQWPERG
jgi:hypothetical protein